MKLKLNNSLIWLIVLTAIGFTLRIWGLDHFPPALNWDEISHGYNAYSLLLTGRDEWGVSWPLIFRAFGDYKLPLYIYLTLPFVSLFGLSPLSLRLVSVIAGALAIPGIYLLTRQLLSQLKTKSSPLPAGLIAASLLTITPWHFFISRPALEANLGLTLFIYGLYFLLRALDHPRLYLPAAILLALTPHTYNSYRLLTPLVILAFFFIYRPLTKKALHSFILPTLILLSSFALVAYQTISGSGLARYSQLSILTPNTVFQIGQNRLNSDLPPLLARLIHNRPIYFATQVLTHHLSFFSPAFLYQTTGVQTQFAIPGVNLLSLPITLLFLVGLLYLLTTLKSRSSIFLLVLLLLAPLPASITAAPPQALRPTPMLPSLIIISSLGLIFLLSRLRHQLQLPAIILALFLTLYSFSVYLNNYYHQYTTTYSASWQYGYKQAIAYLNQHSSEYDHIFFTKRFGEPHLFYAFYTPLNPRILQPSGDSLRFTKSDWYWTDRVGKVYFINDWLIPSKLPALTLPLESGGEVTTKNSLLFTSYDHIPSNSQLLETINFLDGQPAFVIVKLN